MSVKSGSYQRCFSGYSQCPTLGKATITIYSFSTHGTGTEKLGKI